MRENTVEYQVYFFKLTENKQNDIISHFKNGKLARSCNGMQTRKQKTRKTEKYKIEVEKSVSDTATQLSTNITRQRFKTAASGQLSFSKR